MTFEFEPDEEYLEWVQGWMIRTKSLCTIVRGRSDLGQPLLMPLESFKWSDVAIRKESESRLSVSLLLKESQPPSALPAFLKRPSTTGLTSPSSHTSALTRVTRWLRRSGSRSRSG